MQDSGLYLLVFYLPESQDLKIGSRGVFTFQQGYYVYTGSAKRNLHARLSRHMRKKKTLRWHIDYLSVEAQCIAHFAFFEPIFTECELNRRIVNLQGATMPVKGFGSSDCSCFSHLVYFETYPCGLNEIAKVED